MTFSIQNSTVPYSIMVRIILNDICYLVFQAIILRVHRICQTPVSLLFILVDANVNVNSGLSTKWNLDLLSHGDMAIQSRY